MDFSNDEFIKPLLYRDIMGPANTPMGGMYGLGGMYGMYPYSTNLLGGITMQPGVHEDIFESYQKRKKKDYGFLTKVLAVIGGLAALDLIAFKGFKGLRSLFKKSGSGGGNAFAKRFSSLFSRNKTP